MSRGDRSEQVGFLRGAITRIGGDGNPVDTLSDSTAARVALGHGLALDRLLQGGLGRGALHEVVAARPGDAAAASGFALALAARFAAGHERQNDRPIVWIVEDAARAETGMPYAPGLDAHGIDAARLVVIATADGQESLWAMEEALKSRMVGAVVADLWRAKTYDLVASRRLVLAARKSGTPGLLVPAGAAGHANGLSSAAQTRFEVMATPSRATPSRAKPNHATPHHGLALNIIAKPRRISPGNSTPLPGPAAFGVRLARIRAGPGLECGFDQEKFWPLVWDHEKAWFCDALPVPSLADARDGPAAVRAGGCSP